MQRHSKVLQTKVNAKAVVTALICVVFLLIGLTISSYALEPMPTAPSDNYGTLLDAYFLTELDVQYVASVFNYQYNYGGFDSLVPVLMYRNGSALRLCFTNGSAPYDTDVFYTYDGAGQLNLSVSSYSQSIRFLMTDYGFKGYVTGTIPATLAYEEVLFYRDSNGNFVNNTENFSTVANGDGKAVAYTAFDRWFRWSTQSTGGDVGNGGDNEIVYQLDVGSIISALPQAARNIIDGALGFEIFGINVAGTLTAILVVAIVGFVVKWLLSLKS